jgi:hypothetical protein
LSIKQFDAAPLAPPQDGVAPAAGVPEPVAAAPSAVATAAQVPPFVPAPSTAPATVAPAPVAAQDDNQALRAALDAWLEDWRKQDVAAYLAHYAPGFLVPGKSHAAWERERRQRIGRAVFIRVAADQVRVQAADEARPRVEFMQSYESESYQETSRKVLTFVKDHGRWLIEKEENKALQRP